MFLCTLMCVIFVSMICGCGHRAVFRFEKDRETDRLRLERAGAYPPVKFMVITDVHLYDKSLGTTGKAFEAYLADDRKLLVESEEILDEAVTMILAAAPRFVLVSGDSTKDGERRNHELFAGYLKRITDAGIAVYVIAGNHDVNNPHALRYEGDSVSPVATVSPSEFASLYGPFGFDSAILKDPDSLSYVVEPVPGLWLLLLDSCRYERNLVDNYPHVSGEFGPKRLTWVENVLIEAAKQKKKVIASSHHAIMEHYAGQKKFYGDYVVDDYRDISRLLAAYGVQVLFSGHFHAQDISAARLKEGSIFDIETGSLVTYPCPLRSIEITADQKMKIDSLFIERTASHPQGFREYARAYVLDGIAGMAVDTLDSFNVSRKDAQRMAPQIAAAFVAHYEGDEIFPQPPLLDTSGMGIMARLVAWNRGPLIKGLWRDLGPSDNALVIDLKKGEAL